MDSDAERPSYGLPGHVIAGINGGFARFPDIERVILYGSRVKGTYKRGSDIDFCLVGASLTLPVMLRIDTTLDDLLLPYKIDLALYHHIDNPDLLSHMARVGTVFYQKENP